jgi:hypothetical protein
LASSMSLISVRSSLVNAKPTPPGYEASISPEPGGSPGV